MATKNNFNHTLGKSIATGLKESLATHLQATCIEARKNLFWHQEYGYDYNWGISHLNQSEENRVNNMSDIKFTFVSHRQLFFSINGCDKIYHLAASNLYGNIKDDNMEDSDKNNPYLSIASAIRKASKEYQALVASYETLDKIQYPDLTISENQLNLMSEEDFLSAVHIIYNMLHKVTVDNLMYQPTRELLSGWLQRVFPDEVFSFDINVDENGQLYGNISSAFDKQRKERLKNGQPLCDRRIVLTNEESFINSFVSAFKNYKIEQKLNNKKIKKTSCHFKKDIMNKKNSRMQANPAVDNALESTAQSMAESIMQILCPTGFLAELISSKSVNVSTWISSKTDGRLSGDIANNIVTLYGCKGLSITIQVEEYSDDEREDIKCEISHMIERENRINNKHVLDETISSHDALAISTDDGKNASTDSKDITKDSTITISDEKKKEFNNNFRLFEKIFEKKFENPEQKVDKRSNNSKIYYALLKIGKSINIPRLTMGEYRELLSGCNRKSFDELTSIHLAA